jgi:D-alanyl-D-alanine carboxypeptidase
MRLISQDAASRLSRRSPAAKKAPAKKSLTLRAIAAVIIAALVWVGAGSRVSAAPSLLMELSTGATLYEDHATQPWYPASLTKLMTVYVALKAVQDHHVALDTPLAVSARAAAMPASKMGFRPGTLVTLETALKILMVKSANDIAITVAEGVSGSVEAFADEMNADAAAIGMRQSHFVNPNGLHNPAHYSSARDLALLARALYQTFPEHADLFRIGALEIDGKVIANHNNLLGRYPGVDGMKTGFTCPAGFNVVASATQGGKKLIAVILGAPTVALRTVKAAALFDRGFIGIDRPSVDVAALPLQGGAPPDMGGSICRNRGRAIVEFNAENERLIAPLEAAASQAFASPRGIAYYDSSALSRISPMATRIALVPAPDFEPVPIGIAGYVAPGPQAPGATVSGEAPPEAVSAYAPGVAAATGAGGAELKPDAKALPMKGSVLRQETSRSKAEAEPPRLSAAHKHHSAARSATKSKGKVVAAGHSKHGKDKAAEAKGDGGNAAAGNAKAEARLKQKLTKSSSAKHPPAALAKAGHASAKKAESSATE